jgi:hypothetical protein
VIGDDPHVWLFLSRGTPHEDDPLIAYCESHFHRVSAYASTGVRLFGYVRETASAPGAEAAPPSRP